MFGRNRFSADVSLIIINCGGIFFDGGDDFVSVSELLGYWVSTDGNVSSDVAGLTFESPRIPKSAFCGESGYSTGLGWLKK